MFSAGAWGTEGEDRACEVPLDPVEGSLEAGGCLQMLRSA